MPVLTVRALGLSNVDAIPAATRISAAVADAGGMPHDNVWVLWSEIPAGTYIISGVAPATHPQDSHPVLVEISSHFGRDQESAERMMKAAAEVVGAELGVPATNVRVLYQEALSHRLFTKGRFPGK